MSALSSTGIGCVELALFGALSFASDAKVAKAPPLSSEKTHGVSKAAAFQAWFREGGGWIDPRLVFKRSQNHGRGFFAKAPIRSGELLIWLPKKLMLRRKGDLTLAKANSSTLVAIRSKEWAVAESWIVQGMRDSVPRVAEAAAALAIEVQRGARSRFHPYIALLPSRCPRNIMGSSFGEKNWFRATPAKWIEAYFQTTRQALRLLLQGQGIGEIERDWALCMVISRACGSVKRMRDGQPSVEMWPGLDSLNHASGHGASAKPWAHDPGDEWDMERHLELSRLERLGVSYGEGSGVSAAHDLALGDEVLWSYGDRSNAELQALYGFVPSESEQAVMAPFILPPIAGAPRLDAALQNRLASAGCEMDDEVMRTIVGVPVHFSSMDDGLRAVLRCARVRLRSKGGRSLEASDPWAPADAPLLLSLRSACSRLALAWIRSLAWLTPGIAGSPFAAVARTEALHAERCLAIAQRAIANVAPAVGHGQSQSSRVRK